MSFDESIRQLLAAQDWEGLSKLLDERLESFKSQLSSSISVEEKKAFINEQLKKDVEYLKQVVAQKKEIEQQLLSLKRGKKVSRLYTEEI